MLADEAGSWIGRGAILWLLAVACSPDDSHLYFTDVPYPDVSPPSEYGLRLELVAEYGDREHGLVFGSIRGLAAHEGGTLAVLDRIDCRIWILDTNSGDVDRVGGCGDGPGEFRTAVSASFTGDTLLVFDSGRNSMVKVTLDGEEVGRYPAPLSELGAYAISDLHVWEGGSVLAGLDLLPNGLVPKHQQIAVLDGTTGAVRRRGLVAPPLARTTREPILRDGSLCGASVAGEGEVVVAVNTWGPQVAILRWSDLNPLLSVRVPLDWARATGDPERPGYWAPIGPVPRVACGDRHAVVAYRYQRSVAGQVPEVLRAALVVIDLKERSITVIGGDEPPEPGSALFMTPAAALGDRFFFFTNSFFGYPVVRQYRIVAGDPQ